MAHDGKLEDAESMQETVLDFWFGEQAEGFPIQNKEALWWGGGPEVDADIRTKFGALIHDAEAGVLSFWEQTARGSLALIIILDQFTRNIYRGTAKAFASDAVCLDIAKRGIAKGFDAQLTFSERTCFYRPFMHAEDRADQNRSVALYEALLQSAPDKALPALKNNLKFAIEHQEIIAQFGRFPHRNAALGRVPSAAEDAYLSDGGSRFGQ